MSVKNNAVLAAVAEANTLTLGANIVDAMINDVAATAGVVSDAMDGSGKAVAAVMVAGELRPVCDSGGNIKLYKSGAAGIAALRRLVNGNGISFQYTKQVKSGGVGDPIKTLISKYKSCKTELLAAEKQEGDLVAKIASAEALDWDTATAGSPELVEYTDLQARKTAVTAWKTATATRKTSLETALTAANIDLITLLPVTP